MLQTLFLQLAAKTSNDPLLCKRLWEEIATDYSAADRHYHTLQHLKALIASLEPCSGFIRDYDSILFAVFYHDAVYNVPGSDHEERSADMAWEKMSLLQVALPVREQCRKLILATKAHTVSDDTDVNLFTDADLAVLGSRPNVYQAYCRAIRMEYHIYPDALYMPGRKKVLEYFLAMPRIYKTDHFYDLYEKQARQNIQQEAAAL